MTGTESAAKAVESASDGEDQVPDFLDDPAYMSSASRRMMMKEVIKALPENVQHRVNALKHLQKKYLKLEAKFFEEVYALECKYQELYQPLVDRRKAVITGESELEAGEAEWKEESEDEDDEVDAEVTERFKQMALNYKCTGCTIQWNPSKNVTVKTIKKQQKHKQRGVIRTLTKTLPNDSFFNFFNPPQVQEDDKDVAEETQMLLASDFEIGHFLRARIIPKAILYYTGEVMDEDDDGEEEEEEEEEEDEEEMEEEGEEEEEEEDERPPPAKNQKHRGGRGGGGKKKDGQNPAECQQQ